MCSNLHIKRNPLATGYKAPTPTATLWSYPEMKQVRKIIIIISSAILIVSLMTTISHCQAILVGLDPGESTGEKLRSSSGDWDPPESSFSAARRGIIIPGWCWGDWRCGMDDVDRWAESSSDTSSQSRRLRLRLWKSKNIDSACNLYHSNSECVNV